MSVNELLGWGFVFVVLYGVALLSIDYVFDRFAGLALLAVDALLAFGAWIRDRGESLRQFARRMKLRL